MAWLEQSFLKRTDTYTYMTAMKTRPLHRAAELQSSKVNYRHIRTLRFTVTELLCMVVHTTRCVWWYIQHTVLAQTCTC
jgi:hypothetical protein